MGPVSNLAPNWRFCSFWARLCRLIWCPIGGLVGGCDTQAVSRKTPIYFIIITSSPKWKLMVCCLTFQPNLLQHQYVAWSMVIGDSSSKDVRKYAHNLIVFNSCSKEANDHNYDNCTNDDSYT